MARGLVLSALLLALAVLALAADAPKATATTTGSAPAQTEKPKGKRILLWTFAFATSHHMVFSKIGRELVARGHEVSPGVYLSPSPSLSDSVSLFLYALLSVTHPVLSFLPLCVSEERHERKKRKRRRILNRGRRKYANCEAREIQATRRHRRKHDTHREV